MTAAGRCRGHQDYTLLWSYDLTWVSCNPPRTVLRPPPTCSASEADSPIPLSLPITHLRPPLSSDICSPPTLHRPPLSQPAPRKCCLSAAPFLIAVRGLCPLLSTLPHLQHPGAPSSSACGVGTEAQRVYKVLVLGQWVWLGCVIFAYMEISQ